METTKINSDYLKSLLEKENYREATKYVIVKRLKLMGSSSSEDSIRSTADLVWKVHANSFGNGSEKRAFEIISGLPDMQLTWLCCSTSLAELSVKLHSIASRRMKEIKERKEKGLK